MPASPNVPTPARALGVVAEGRAVGVDVPGGVAHALTHRHAVGVGTAALVIRPGVGRERRQRDVVCRRDPGLHGGAVKVGIGPLEAVSDLAVDDACVTVARGAQAEVKAIARIPVAATEALARRTVSVVEKRMI